MNQSDFFNFFRSKKYMAYVWSVFGLAALAGVFSFGAMVGSNKAKFNCSWVENYQRNFGGPMSGFMAPLDGQDIIEGHGVFGKIIKIDGMNLVIKGKDNVERVVNLGDDSLIRRAGDTINSNELNPDDTVVIIGDPNNYGQINAKFIRIMLPPLMSSHPMIRP